MTVDREKMRARIEKLMNLANDPAAFKGEIDNAMRFARRLMVQHNIDENELRKPGQTVEDQARNTSYGEAYVYTFGRDMSKWEGYLASAICELVQTCHNYRVSRQKFDKVNPDGSLDLDTHGRPRQVTRIVFYGPIVDINECVDLFNEWVSIIVALSRMRFGSWVRNEARSFNEGFTTGIWRSVKKAKSEEEGEARQEKGAAGALVVVTANSLMAAKARYATEWLQKKGTKLRSSRVHANRGDDPEAFRKGVEEGERAGFSRNIREKLT